MNADDPRLPKSVLHLPKFMAENPPTVPGKKRRRLKEDDLLAGMVIQQS